MEAVRVLIVDDEAELVSALTERLEIRGFEADGVTSGAAALDALEEGAWDVVLLDVRMPGIGGFELTREIRARHPETAVVLLTGRTDTDDEDESRAAGAAAYLIKPIPIEELESALTAAAGGRAEP